jgi:radical SAM protein with 4Fe4S-binding SPASM domain
MAKSAQKLAFRPPCAGLWDTPMVQVNGDVTTCCLDEHLENKVGNVNHNPLAEIWKSKTMDDWRTAQVAGRFEDSGPYCTRCNWRSAGTLSPERVAAWQSSRGMSR